MEVPAMMLAFVGFAFGFAAGFALSLLVEGLCLSAWKGEQR